VLKPGVPETDQLLMASEVPKRALVRFSQLMAIAMIVVAIYVASRDLGIGEAIFLALMMALSGAILVTSHRLARSLDRAAEADEVVRFDQRTARILDHSNEAYVGMDAEGKVTAWNAAAETMFGWKREEALGHEVAELIVPEDMREAHRSGLERFLLTGSGPIIGPRTELLALHRDGSEVPVELSVTALEEKGVWHFHGFVRDITERRLLERQQAKLLAHAEETARIDALTALPNRRHWDEELGRELARARRHGNALCVALLDLDHFKAFNDSHGHREGDRLLRNCAAAWRMALRGSDFLARYGGEEFAALLPDCDLEGAMEVIERLRLNTPEVQTVSAGVAQWNGYEVAAALIDRADLALYEAKRGGRDRATAASQPA
jgi:diguanylate cyclase (GGDEF)-like protein/PAS domain S-box-containing protein